MRADRAGRGERLGWPNGGFAGRTVTPALLAQRGARARRGRRAIVRGLGRLVPHDGHVASAGDYAIRFQSVNHRADVWVDGRRVARHTGHLPALRGARAPGRRRARARRARRLAQPGGDEGRRLAPHVVQLRRHQPRRCRSARSGPASSTRRRSSPAWTGNAAVVDVAVRVTNRAGRADDRRARHGGRRRAALRAGPPGARRPRHGPRAGADRAARSCGSPATRRSTTLRLEVPGESVFTARVGLRELRWAGGRLQLNGQPLKLRGASLQEDAPGRGDALTDADMRRDRRAAEGDRRQRHAQPAPADAGAARPPRRRGDPRLAGRRPGRRARRVDVAHARAAAPRDPPRAPERPAGAAAPERRGLEPRQRGRRQRALRRPARVRRRGRPARAPPRPRAPGRGRRVGHAHADRAGLHVPPHRRRRRDQLRGLVRGHARPARHGPGRHRRLAGALARPPSRARC